MLTMKKLLTTLLILFVARFAYANSILFDSFEYANNDGMMPIGWTGNDNTWLAGHMPKDHNRVPHSGEWYAYTNSTESWMFMPMHMSTQLKYRFTLWAISDGEYQLEIWGGNEPSPSDMTQLLLSAVASSSYEQFSAYIEEIVSDYEYFGVHAVSGCSDCILTIDDINVDMVDKYGLDAMPANLETNMMPGTQTEFQFKFKNTGYEPLTVYMTPHTEYFSDIRLFANGVEATSFPAAPDEILEIRGIATMLPDVALGSLTWIDITFWLDCGCATTMFTLWATAGYESIDECDITKLSIYPNPSSGNVTIEGNSIVTITNMLGQIILQKEIVEKETVTLEKGVYSVKMNDRLSEKLIVK